MTVFINYFSSFAAGAVIFMYLGYMSKVTEKPISEVAKDGRTFWLENVSGKFGNIKPKIFLFF